MSSIKKNVNPADNPVQSNLADQNFKQVRARLKTGALLEKEVAAEEDMTDVKEVDVTSPIASENMGDRPVLMAQAPIVEVVVDEKPVDDKEFSLLKDAQPASLSEASSASAGAAADAGKSALSWLPIAGGVGAVGVLAGGKGGGGSAEKPAVSVESVAITSVTDAQNNTLNAGDVVTVTVNMSETVVVSGTPQLALNIGGAVVQANYVSGSGTNQLVFSYTIQAGQADGNGIAIAANALRINGGSIRNTAGGDAVLTHAAVADNVSYMVDTTAPGISHVQIGVETVGGDVVYVYVDMTEAVNVSGTPQLAMNLGGVSVLANYDSGSGTNQLVFSYTVPLGQTYHNGVAIAANALQLNAGTLQDVAGNNAVLTHAAVALSDDGLPLVSQMTITSATGAQNNTLNAGDVITVTVDMSDVVQVVGTPQLALTIGSAVVQANYASGSGTNQLVFSYTIQSGQTDSNGIAIAANALQLNGGSISNTAGNAVLTHVAVADNASYMVDTTAPGISHVQIEVETVGGDVVYVYVDMTEAVNVSGTPQLAMSLGGVSVLANYASGSGTNQLVFSYTIPLGQTYHNGVVIAADALQASAGTLHDVAGNDAVLTHAAVALSDDGSPLLTQLAITSATGAQNNTLNVGDMVTVTVDLSDAVVVSGTPQLALTIGSAVVQANYVSGSGTNQLVFSYTIQAGQMDGNGIAIAANALQLNGGSIRNTVGDAVLTHVAVTDNASYMVDTTAPGISQMQIDVGTIGGGDVVYVRVDMTEAVNVSGTPQLAMNLGGVSVLANYASGSGTNQLVFSYTVPLGQTYHNGVAIAANALQLNAGTLQDVAGNSAVLTHAAVVLPDDGLPLVTQMTITSATGAQNNTLNAGDVVTVTVNMSDAVQVGGTPQLALTIGSAVVQANYVSGSGTNQLVFSYTIQSGQTDSNGIAIAANALQLNGGSISNSAGNAVLTHVAVADNASYMVDNTFPDITITPTTVTNSAFVSTQSDELVTAYLVHSSVVFGSSVNNITSAADNLWNSVSISATNTTTFLATSGLIAGIYIMYAVDAAGNLAQAPNYVTIVSGSVAASSIQLSTIAGGTGGFAINGQATSDSMGYSVSWAGDVNGDGLDDLIMGAHWADVGALLDAGKSYVVFGKSTGAAIDLSAVAAGTGGFVINGEATGDQMGYSVSGAGDVNGDGLADLLVGARLANGGVGKSYVVFGKRNNTDTINLSAIAAGTGGFVMNGQAANDASGVGVSGAGDVNGDGLDDLIIGTYQADPNGFTDAGKSYVVFGRRNSTAAINLSAVEAGTGGFVINGQTTGENAGFNVSGAGDVNGDGLADLIVGAHGAAPSSISQAGKSYVVFGKSTGTVVNLSAVEGGTGGFVINGQAAFDWSGISVSGAGDVNGDGFADLIVGANGADPAGLLNAGKSYVVFGKSNGAAINLSAVEAGTGGFVINGQAAGDNNGLRVSGAGDVNGDGLADLIVGAYYANSYVGKSYVVFGKANGAAINLSAIEAGTGGFVINGQAASDNSGVGVSAAGDVNGDGLADLIVGANGADPTGLNGAGKSYVIFGSTMGAFNQTAVDALGTSGDDNLNDGGVARTLVGGAGNDSIVATAASVLYGGMGNDSFSIGSAMITALQSNYGAGGNLTQLAQVGGGTGVDTLSLVGSGLTLDLTLIANQAGGYEKVASRLSSIEKIDLTGSGNNTLRLAVKDLLDMSGVNDLLGLSSFAGRHQLAVSGNAGDQVVITDKSNWGSSVGSYTVDGVEYAAYNHNTAFATLFVQTGVTVL